MSQRFDDCVKVVLAHEGGFVDDPRDPGGATNMGISLRYARSLGSMLDLNGDGTVDRTDIIEITAEKAKMVYRNWFWKDVRGDELPAGVDLVVFDFAVNSGAGRAIKALQKTLGVAVDGVFGPATKEALKRATPESIIIGVSSERIKFLSSLKTWDTYKNGWGRRVAETREYALAMIGRPAMTVAEAAATDGGKATITVASIGLVSTALAQAEPALRVLGSMTPWVAIALIGAALVGALIWRSKKA